jgi:hypothetical protein
MNCECRSVDGLIPDHHLPILVHQNKVRDTDLREVLRKRIKPEVIRENRISNGDVTCDTLVEPSLCKSKEN